MEKPIRMDKYVSSCTEFSRKDAKALIRAGRIIVNGKTERREEYKITAEDEILLDGERLTREKYVYYMLNKPCGVVSATKDGRDRTVVELIKETNRDIFPVGRLDKDTEGVLFLTDDGELAHTLLSPKYHVEKTYALCYDGELNPESVSELEKGIDIGEKNLTRPARLELLEKGKARLTISEGKYHQVKRMIAALGGHVTYLKRISMAGIVLDESLAPGEYRRLTDREIRRLQEAGRKE